MTYFASRYRSAMMQVLQVRLLSPVAWHWLVFPERGYQQPDSAEECAANAANRKTPLPKRELDEGGEGAFYFGEEGADDAVEFGFGDADGGDFAAEEHGVFDADGVVAPDKVIVAAQDEFEDFRPMFRRPWQDVRFIAERALTKREPHRGEFFLDSTETHVPAPLPRSAVIGATVVDGQHRWVRS
jgi:hypothetical protein